MRRSVIQAATCALAVMATAAHGHLYFLSFSMAGDRVVPESDSDAYARGLFVYNHHSLQYQLEIRFSGITLDDLYDTGPNNTPLHIYNARRGENGPIVIDPGLFGEFTEDSEGVTFTLDVWTRLGGTQGNFSSGLFANEYALYEGHLYVQLFTQDHPEGAIRGQLPHYHHYAEGLGLRGFVDPENPPFRTRIPAPGGVALACLAGLAAIRRRR